MVMIDALLEAAGGRGVAAKTFRRGEYGVCGDVVCETVLVECVAQATAALLAYGKPASFGGEAGFLAGLSSFTFARRPRIDERLLIEARLGRGFGEWLMVGGKIFAGEIGGECIAGGELKIYLKNTKAQGKTPWKI
jgi:hypothetical protein